MKTLLRRSGVTLAGLLLLLITALVMVLGTESGTRWALNQAVRFVPGELAIEEFHGTLLGGLEVSTLNYRNDAMHLAADDLVLRLDWFRSSLDRVHLSVLSMAQFTYRTSGPADPTPKPLQISMPPLPIRLGVSDLDVRALHIGDASILNLLAANADIRGNRINAAAASGEIAGIAINVGGFSTTLDGDVPVSGNVAWSQTAGPWSGNGRISGSLETLEFSHELSGPYPASAEGRAFLLRRIDPEVEANVRFEQWRFSSLVLGSGKLSVKGTTQAYRGTFDTDVGVEVGDGKTVSAQVAGDASGNLEGLESLSLDANGPGGQLQASGNLAWSPGFFTDVELRGQQLDPSQVSSLAAGKLNTALRLQFRSIEDFSVKIESLDGIYNDERARAAGTLSRDPDKWRCASCEFLLGPNRAHVDGELAAESITARLDIDAPDLSLLWSELAGAITADAQLRGSVALPIVSGHVTGRNVDWTAWAISSLDLTSRSSTLEKVDLDFSIEGLEYNGSKLGGGSARLTGQIDAVDTDLRWAYGELDVELKARVAVDGDTATAQLRSASVTEPYAGTWQLSQAMQISMSPGVLRATPHAWRNGDARADLTSFSLDGGVLETEASLVAMPLATLNVALPDNVQLRGFADAGFRFNRGVDGSRSGELHWSQRDTVMRIAPPRDEAIDLVIPVATAELRLVGAGAEGQATVEIEPGVSGSLDFAIDGFDSDSRVSATLRFGGTEWDWISAFFPEIDNFQGEINADISAIGDLAEPELRGELRWRNGSLAVPALNVPFSDIALTVTGSSAGSATVAGSATAGGGKLVVDGRFDDLTRSNRSFKVSMSGQQATLLNWPDYQLVASPDLVFTGSESGVRAGGKINVDRAEISVSELPEGAVSPSDDVSVAGRDMVERNVIPVSGSVELLLSENVHIVAFGLDSKVQGQLRFTLPDGRDPRATGELKLVDGVFSAYGQRLTIEEGTMTFTGPLDDPVIYVRAVREIEDLTGTIKAGIELRGRAQNLSSTVFSSPSMSEADALSYLILGRPLQDASAADGSVLSGTAFALGMRQATAITNQIGQTLGLDQLAVAGSDESTTALVAGKQINSKLYVRYAYGVFSQVGNLLLRYKLSKRLTIEAGTGESQSMDLLYLVEKP